MGNKKRLSIHFAEINLHDNIELLNFMERKERGKLVAFWVAEWISTQISESIDWNSEEEQTPYFEALRPFNDSLRGSQIYAPKFLDFLNTNIHYIEKIQQDIRRFIKEIFDGYKKTEQQKREFGANLVRIPMDTNSQGQLLEKINQIKFEFTYAIDKKNGFRIKPVIQQKIQNFEQLIYKDFMDHLNEQQEFIICKSCDEVIADPSKIQVSNYYQGKGALHEGCREDYKRKQARIRKQRSRGKI
ncbi:hypothetical protein [Bacillus tuaregi]|uniref:hypothetical protein n=1 Tax=Bacillus tuaregi TaxID=1816695 RepID=UPI0008F84DFF|nr:hypothetical protein [Bacillus tuaregi]